MKKITVAEYMEVVLAAAATGALIAIVVALMRWAFR